MIVSNLKKKKSMDQASTNRLSTFLRIDPSRRLYAPKRALTDQEPEPKAKRGSPNFKKYTQSVPVLDIKPLQGGATPLQKEVSNPWEWYQVIFKIKQADLGHFAHTKDDTFLETIVKDIKVHGEDLLSKLTAASHKNIVTF